MKISRQKISPIGAHVSAAGGLHNAPLEAAKLGLDCFQFFSRSPQGGRASAITPAEADKFRSTCEETGLTKAYVHAPFIINLASGEERIRRSSIGILKTELERAAALGVQAVMTHVGSAKDVGTEKGVELAIAGVREILAAHDGELPFLIEISAGAGAIIGDTFEEVAAILDACDDERLGVCFDTAHAFASGYDLRTADSIAGVMKSFDAVIGLKHLFMAHFNDSKAGLGERKDRHEHIGPGQIGKSGFRALMASDAFRGLPLILETPSDEQRLADVALLKSLRGKIR